MRVLLGVSGSVAAIKIPELAQQLCDHGHEVAVVPTSAATHFFAANQLPSHVKLHRRSPHCYTICSLSTDACVCQRLLTQLAPRPAAILKGVHSAPALYPCRA